MASSNSRRRTPELSSFERSSLRIVRRGAFCFLRFKFFLAFSIQLSTFPPEAVPNRCILPKLQKKRPPPRMLGHTRVFRLIVAASALKYASFALMVAAIRAHGCGFGAHCRGFAAHGHSLDANGRDLGARRCGLGVLGHSLGAYGHAFSARGRGLGVTRSRVRRRRSRPWRRWSPPKRT